MKSKGEGKLWSSNADHLYTCADPKYEEEVSGCTACVSLIAGNKIYVVSVTILMCAISGFYVVLNFYAIGKCW